MPARWLTDCLLLAALLCSTAAHAAENRWLVIGEAIRLDTGEPAYREIHDISTHHHTVQYVGPDEHPLAHKTLGYPQGYSTPLYLLEDLRDGRRSGSEWQDGQFVLFRESATGKRQQAALSPAPDLVIDAGFDHFIRAHWERLLAGESLPFAFAIVDPLVTLDMSLRAVPAAESAIAEKRDDYRYFVARSRHRLISWAIPAIHLAYAADEKRLCIYQGPSNITDSQDKNPMVLIRYQYRTAPLLAQGDHHDASHHTH